MKRIKLIILFGITFLITGCSVDYDLVITDNKKVKESVKIINTNELILLNNNNIDLYLDSQIDTHRRISMFRGYKFSKNVGDISSYIRMKRTHSSLEDYVINSPFFRKLFQDAKIESEDDYVSFNTVGDYYYTNVYGDNYDPSFYIGDINIKMKFYNEIVDNNADNYDKKNNTLEWKITSEDTEKSLYFKLSNDKRYDIILIDYFIENKITIITISSIVVILLIIGIYAFSKYRKNNEI